MESLNSSNFNDTVVAQFKDNRITNIVVYCVLFPAIIAIGIFGNILTITILRKQMYKSSSTYLQITLAVTDLLLLFVRSLFALYRCGHLFFPEFMFQISQYLSSYAVNISSQIFHRMSKLILIPIMVDRILVIWTPFHFRKIMTKRVSVFLIGSICTISCILNTVEVVEIMIVEYTCGETVSGTSSIEELHRHHRYTSQEMYFYRTAMKVTFDIFPIIAVFVCNILIIIGFRRQNLSMKYISNELFFLRRLQERKMTLTLLTISIVFLVLCLPLDVVVFTIYFNLVKMSPLVQATLPKFTQVPSLANHSVNFIVYGLTNRSYWREAKKLLTCYKRKKSNTGDSSDSNTRSINTASSRF